MHRITSLRRWTIALLVALVAAAAVVGSAAAASAPAERQPPASAALTRGYRAELKRLKLQEQRLAQADEFAAKVDALIAKLKTKGKSTTALEAALANYRTGMASARAEWQLAANVLQAHLGFDADGKVTDPTAASATLKQAHGHIEQAHKLAHVASLEMRLALAQIRKETRGLTIPTLPIEP